MIMEGQRWFLGLVTARRNVKTAEVAGLEQGRVFSGREAQTLKLVDEIGGEPEALRYLHDKPQCGQGSQGCRLEAEAPE